MLSTVQDGGRPELAHLGVPRAGACDPWALAAANTLLGNPADAAALEITVAGPELQVLATCVVALAGADLGAHVPEEGRLLPPGAAYLLRGGTRLAFKGGSGARAYVALPGGIAVPPVLGSAATYLAGGFGGVGGRALRPGDRLRARTPEDRRAAGRRWPEQLPGPAYAGTPIVRVLPGPHGAWFAPDALQALVASEWEVGPQ
ncbi:MAG TPA: biotin-dependent carboxyltransferase family protein, partial [Chloroflexia bacterium]|nr:biotin-dependent carboxyltransferase family protein [Chloroflexia bacterium]